MVPFVFEVDFSSHIRPTKLDRGSAVPLARQLINAAPPDIGPGVRRALQAVREAAVELRSVLKERERVDARKIRPLDEAVDNAWGALKGRIESVGRLPDSASPHAARAREIVAAIFDDGLKFLLLDSKSEWEEGEQRLERIVEEGFERDVIDIAGRDHYEHLKAAQAALGEVLGIGTSAPSIPSPTGLSDTLTAMAQRISIYVRMLSAECNVEDKTSVDRFLRAIAPLEAHRAGRASSSPTEGASDEETDVAPIPAVPAPLGVPVSPTGPGAPFTS